MKVPTVVMVDFFLIRQRLTTDRPTDCRQLGFKTVSGLPWPASVNLMDRFGLVRAQEFNVFAKESQGERAK